MLYPTTNTTRPHRIAPRITNAAGPPVNAEITIQITAEMIAERPLLESMLTARTLASITKVAHGAES
jgi:hypothetical protein